MNTIKDKVEQYGAYECWEYMNSIERSFIMERISKYCSMSARQFARIRKIVGQKVSDIQYVDWMAVTNEQFLQSLEALGLIL